jgi:SET domain-containing protein
MNKISLQNVQFLMPNNLRKYPLKQEQFKDFQALHYKLKDFQVLEFLFPNSRTSKDFQVMYEPWVIQSVKGRFT